MFWVIDQSIHDRLLHRLRDPRGGQAFDKTILHLRRESSARDYRRTKTNPPKRSEKGK